jgi:hypothetical protein
MVIVCCPECGKQGFLTKRWVRSSYYPKFHSEVCDSLEMAERRLSINPDNKESIISVGSRNPTKPMRLMKLGVYFNGIKKRVRGNRYMFVKRDITDKRLGYKVSSNEYWHVNVKKDFTNKNPYYRVSSRKYWHYYVGHYDSIKYENQMIKYKERRRKSRPNGRKWCKVKLSNYHFFNNTLAT